MPLWDAAQYRKFEAERLRPCRDLVGRIELEHPTRLVDLGCGPGTSARVLRERWPDADVEGVDSSTEMLAVARAEEPRGRWTLADLRTWNPDGPVDLLFANASLQWVPDPRALIPKLWRNVAPGGAFAFQVPFRGSPPPAWLRALEAADYYDLLAPVARAVDLWDTEYVHVLPGPESVVEWTKGTGLRPLLERLGSDEARRTFLEAYAERVAAAFPRRPDRRHLFPFRRRFVIAYR